VDLFIDNLVSEHLREISRCLFDDKCYHLAQTRLFTESVENLQLIVFFGYTGILFLKLFIAGLPGNDDYGSQVTHTFNEFSKDLHFGLDAAKLGGEDRTGSVEDFVGNPEVFVGFVHAFADVVGRTIELPSEKVVQLKLKEL
jgi:hypothetical protein